MTRGWRNEDLDVIPDDIVAKLVKLLVLLIMYFEPGSPSKYYSASDIWDEYQITSLQRGYSEDVKVAGHGPATFQVYFAK